MMGAMEKATLEKRMRRPKARTKVLTMMEEERTGKE